MIDSLKPCPFCGGEAVLEAEYIRFPGEPRNKFFAVKCVTENCPAANIAQDGELGGFIYSLPRQRAIDAWNRRVPTSEGGRDE